MSPDWFAQLPQVPALASARQPDLVLEISLTGAPEGEVRYQVVLDDGEAWVLPPERADRCAHVHFSSDYATVAAIAAGQLSAVDALAGGLARVAGDISALSALAVSPASSQLVPASLRAGTTY